MMNRGIDDFVRELSDAGRPVEGSTRRPVEVRDRTHTSRLPDSVW